MRSLVVNPYSGIDWATIGRHRANFHCHTTESSDGLLSIAELVGFYHDAGYKILGITDHNDDTPNGVTWQWNDFETLSSLTYNSETGVYSNGMLGISGNEHSYIQDVLAFNTTYLGTEALSDPEVLLPILEKAGALSIFPHPGRYNRSIQWWVNMYKRHLGLIGFEAFNMGDRYSGDRDTWDYINLRTMPNKPVWGYSNDDTHNTSHLFRNYNVMLLPSLTKASLLSAMSNGASYFCYEPEGSGTHAAPTIDEIEVDEEEKTITITATGANSISWIANGSIFEAGSTFYYGSCLHRYIRAKLVGDSGETYTQPFGLSIVPVSPVRVKALMKDASYLKSYAKAVIKQGGVLKDILPIITKWG